jgi:hypothetical protein
VDDAGFLRVQQGRPDFLGAKDFAEMDQYPGAVFSTPMEPGGADDHSSDPDNGLQ